MNHHGRIEAIERSMRQDNLDALVITRNGGIAYAAGVLVPWRTAIVVTEGHVELITVRNDVSRVLDLTWIEDHRVWQMADPDGFPDAVVDSLRDRGVDTGRIGVDLVSAQHPGAISASEYLTLTKSLPSAEWVNGIDTLDRVMLVKDHEETELLRRAAEIADLGMEAAFAAIAPGRTELEIAGVAEAAMRTAGNEFVWSVTGTEVGSGYRQRYELGFTVAPSTKRIQRGDIVTVDLHPMVGCYLGDLALNAVVGKPSDAQLELEAAWVGIAETILGHLKPGAAIADVARAASQAALDRGYDKYTIPFFGHGLGTDARIPPTITEANPNSFEEGMVFEVLVQTTVPEVGGLRLETATRITAGGYELLNKSPIELRVLDV
jgi:Xaa-Pro aminopeptidase